jgi:hypothetical protein
MTDLSDVNMEGVKPMSDAQELPIGTYLVRIEDTEKKPTKEKFDEAGTKLPPNYFLQFSLQVYGGPNDGQVDFTRLNLWNTNETAVRIAKSELKSIQDAIGIASPNSDHYHGRWMVMEVRPGRKEPEKTTKHYSVVPPGVLVAFKHVPPVPVKTHQQPAAATAQAQHPQTATSTPAVANALPSWAQKK